MSAWLPLQVLLTNAHKYSKGILSEILDFVMGKGLIPADGEIWRTRRWGWLSWHVPWC